MQERQSERAVLTRPHVDAEHFALGPADDPGGHHDADVEGPSGGGTEGLPPLTHMRLKMGRSVPDCELFAGKSLYEEPLGNTGLGPMSLRPSEPDLKGG